MSDKGEGGGGKGSTIGGKGKSKVIVKEKTDVKVKPQEAQKYEVNWRVLLHNDHINTFDYVSNQLAEVGGS